MTPKAPATSSLPKKAASSCALLGPSPWLFPPTFQPGLVLPLVFPIFHPLTGYWTLFPPHSPITPT